MWFVKVLCLIEKVNPVELMKAKYGYIKDVEHTEDIYVYMCQI